MTLSSFTNNNGLGLYDAWANPLLLDGNTFSDNQTAPGLMFYAGGSASVTNNTIAGNTNLMSNWVMGGAVYGQINGTDDVVGGNVISGNVGNNGTGLYIDYSGSGLDVTDNLIVDNTAWSGANVRLNDGGSNSDVRAQHSGRQHGGQQRDGQRFHDDRRVGQPDHRRQQPAGPGKQYEIADANGIGLPAVDATNNWWGIADAATVFARAYDTSFDFTRGLIATVPFLGAPDAQAPAPPAGIPAPSTPTPTATGRRGQRHDRRWHPGCVGRVDVCRQPVRRGPQPHRARGHHAHHGCRRAG